MKVSFFTCKCGLQLKVVQNVDEQISTYICRCRNKTPIVGGSVEMIFGADAITQLEPVWIPIPKTQIVPE